MSAPKMAVGGGLGVLVIALIAMFLGQDPTQLLEQVGAGGGVFRQETGEERPLDPQEEALATFARVVLADTEDVWHALLDDGRQSYREPTLVLFRDAVQSGCGVQQSAVGPFYCPADSSLYLDLQFFEDLQTRFGAAGDFAQAYVIAHEVGHHIQNLTGKSGEVHAQRQRLPEAEYNQLSVRLELQADYYAGVWAHHAQRMFDSLEPGDIEEALNAAAMIGDDTLQRRAGRRIEPYLFTHGTAEQRQRWFQRGYQWGDPARGDTFSVPESQL